MRLLFADTNYTSELSEALVEKLKAHFGGIPFAQISFDDEVQRDESGVATGKVLPVVVKCCCDNHEAGQSFVLADAELIAEVRAELAL